MSASPKYYRLSWKVSVSPAQSIVEIQPVTSMSIELPVMNTLRIFLMLLVTLLRNPSHGLVGLQSIQLVSKPQDGMHRLDLSEIMPGFGFQFG